MDQANRLRDMVKARHIEMMNQRPEISTRIISVTSGKGGVGKTNFTVNLAIQFSKMNKRVLIIDGDFGLANIEVLFGIVPRFHFGDVLNGSVNLADALTDGPMGIKFLSGGSGLFDLANMSERQLMSVVNQFSVLDNMSDVILIDTGAGISSSVVSFVLASNETIILTTSEPTSLADAYAIVKSVKEVGINLPEFNVVVNRVYESGEGMEVFEKFKRVSEKFLGVGLKYLGSLPYDEMLIRAVKKQVPVAVAYPDAMFCLSMEHIARRLLGIEAGELPYVPYSAVSDEETGIASFITRLIEMFKKDMKSKRAR